MFIIFCFKVAEDYDPIDFVCLEESTMFEEDEDLDEDDDEIDCEDDVDPLEPTDFD